MKKFLGFILFIFLISVNSCYAAKYKFLVLPNDLFLEQKNFVVYQQSATLIGTDIVNYYNKHPDMSAVQIGQIKSYLEKPENYRLKKEVQKLLENYHTNYVIDFSTLQKLATKFGAKQVLLISCNMDAQNYVTRRTLWDAIDIGGATVVDPAYRLSSQISLIDPNNQIILWQNNYQKLISSRESRIITPNVNDAGEQLEKIKKYSVKFLSPQVVQETQLALLNMSPYQDLNLHPEIVKPNYVSIDKIKIDTKRASVRGAKYAKNQSILAGQTIAAESIKLANKGKTHFLHFKDNLSDKIAEQKIALEQSENMSIDEKIKQMQEQEQAKLELQKAKQKLKFEKKQQKAKLKAAKKQAKMEAKLQLQQEKNLLLQQTNSSENNLENVNNKIKENNTETKIQTKTKVKENKVKKSKTKNNNEVEINTNSNIEVVPSSTIMQQEYKPVPYVRTKPIIREIDYTINDF